MSGPYVPGAHDHEIASLRRQVASLEQLVSHLQSRDRETLIINGRVGESLRMMTDYMEDVLLRLGKVERTVFPNLKADLEKVQKLIGPGGDGTEYKLDRGAPQKPK